ncbi:Na(+), Li(+), K(+)/H(+) antiporter [Dyadobacter sp. CECT 9275]|uniref:Na(+), Li(+), K(+)/H(+) antiporter n=1 Tax=Dyadobacter helix TaxID=2822344 RepID=A0A916NE47_9BACT|nr:MFS transporter [Dyadobacter sp. CECT 9275]CAG5017415.1 Na(+), Li(+), K(+)/H(+) antiporter [Dyadobacter sp. CECT 9275]
MIQKILYNYRVSFSGLSREIWLLSFVVLINRCGYMAVPFMSMYITQNMHRSISDAGLIITLFGVGSVLGAMAGGYFTDIVGFRPVQIISLVISGLLFVLFGEIDDFGEICLLTVVLSFFVEAFKPANHTAIASYATNENLTRSYSLNRLATNLGFGFGTSVGGILAAINYHLLFWVDGVVYILAGLLIWILLPSSGKIIQKKPEDLSGPSPWQDPFFVRFIILVTAYMLSFLVLFRLVPVYWKEHLHINESVIGLLIGVNGIIIGLFEMVLIQNLEGRKNGSWYIGLGIIFTGASYVMLMNTGFMPVIIAAATVILFTVGEMLTIPYMATIVMSRASEHNRGKYSAAYAMSGAVAQIIGPALGGFIAEKAGYDVLWCSLVGLCAVCALGFRFIFRKETVVQSKRI